MNKLNYRPDIDGLRALAVMLVVGFHTFPNILVNGFIGVDIFFVISGYLITGIILEGLHSKKFNFLEFYARRIRRIFPSLILVLCACFFAGWFILFKEEYAQLGLHILGGGGFFSNWILLLESGYFDNAGHTKPLLHLWSLSIEEQFYIAWPLVLWFGYRRKWNILRVTIGIAAASLFLNVIEINFNPTTTFYLPFTRFWELLFGALLAIYFLRENPITFTATQCNVLSIFGILFIIFGLIFTESIQFPGWYALFPVAGSVLLIAAGQHSFFNCTVLASKPFVFIGLISYPLYLWHWPILSFLRFLLNETPSVLIRVLAMAVAVLLSWATYVWLDRPIRFGPNRRLKTTILIVLMGVIAFVGWNTYARKGLEFRFKTLGNRNELGFRGWQQHMYPPGTINCEKDFSSFRYAICITTPDPITAVIGDSHAATLIYGLVNSENSDFNHAMVVAGGGCQPALGMHPNTECNQQLIDALAVIKRTPTIKNVVIAGYFQGDLENASKPRVMDAYVKGYGATINTLKRMDKKVIFYVDAPVVTQDPSKCVRGGTWLRGYFQKIPNFCAALTSEDLVSTEGYSYFIERLKAENPEVIFYDPRDLFCPNEKCSLFKDGMLLYSDNHHLSIYGSSLIVNGLIDSLYPMIQK